MYITYALTPITIQNPSQGEDTHRTSTLPPHLLYSLLPTTTKVPCERDTQLLTIKDTQSRKRAF